MTAIAVAKIQDYAQFIRLRLTLLVVFSAAAGALIAMGGVGEMLLPVSLGGFLVTAAANGFNQFMECDADKSMERTAGRPLPSGRMSGAEAWWFATAMGASGIFILFYFTNVLSGMLGAASIFLYTLVYTPLKKKTPFAVMVGAVPGALPPVIGWAAVHGNIGIEAALLFVLQFLWQFPHFWAVAWIYNCDYRKAGFQLLPSGAPDKASAFHVLVYTAALLPFCLFPWWFGLCSAVSAALIGACSTLFLWFALRLFLTCALPEARKLLYASFFYLPAVLLIWIADNT